MKLRGEGRIFQRPGTRVWWMAYFVRGKEHRVSTGQVDERKAGRKLRRRVEEVARGEITAESTGTLGLDAMLALVQLDYELKKHRTGASLRYRIGKLVEHFGAAKEVRSIAADHVDAYVVKRRNDGAADSTIRSEVHVLDRGFRLAVEKRKLLAPFRPMIKNVNVGDSNARQGFFERSEVEALAREFSKMRVPEYGDVVLFLFHSGWRIGEVRALAWADYDRDEHGFRLRREKDKTKRGRLLPMVGELDKIIKRRRAARRIDCRYVFHRRGRPIGDFGKRWATACEAIGVSGRVLHDLRRSAVKHMRRSGVDPQTIMRFTGHRTMATFTRYNIVDVDDLRDALRRSTRNRGRVVRLGRGREADPVQNPVQSAAPGASGRR